MSHPVIGIKILAENRWRYLGRLNGKHDFAHSGNAASSKYAVRARIMSFFALKNIPWIVDKMLILHPNCAVANN